MADGSSDRAVAWAEEMRRVHDRLREADGVVRTSIGSTEPYDAVSRDVLLHCWGFCQALTGHHLGEDNLLFVSLRVQRPQLGVVLARLRTDHNAIAHLLTTFAAAVNRSDRPDELERHLDGIEAIMTSHFGYEERQLLPALERFSLDAPVEAVFGPLAGGAPTDER